MKEATDTRNFLLQYEMANSFLPLTFIPTDWLQDKLASYLVWKIKRKLKRMGKMQKWIEEGNRRFAK